MAERNAAANRKPRARGEVTHAAPLSALNAGGLNRTLFIADNLPVLRGIDSESVDLIATDPPFNKGVKAFEGIVTAGTDKGGKKVSYKDVWTWGDVQEEWAESIRLDHPNLYDVIQAANAAAGEDMGAFLCWLGVRVLEMHRVLKPTGSLYLHIDHTAHAYTKAMMDAIFGRRHFRNELVWCYKGMPGKAARFQQKHDTILFYVKSDAASFNVLVTDPDPGSLKTFESAKRVGYNANHRRNMVTVFDWDKYRAAVKAGKIPAGMMETEFDGGNPPMRDWWDDIKILGGPKNKERTGYPTQKPLALYERIIQASSNEGDIVLDPFAGCATTCVAAEHLGREWIAIDINREAEGVIFDRLRREASLPPGARSWKREVSVKRTPPRRTDDGEKAAPELVLVSPKLQGPRMSLTELRSRLSVSDGAYCQGCGFPAPSGFLDYLEVDHKMPKSLGGGDDLRNRVLLCPPCNGVKSNRKTLAELRENRIAEKRMQRKGWDSAWYERVGRFGEPA